LKAAPHRRRSLCSGAVRVQHCGHEANSAAEMTGRRHFHGCVTRCRNCVGPGAASGVGNGAGASAIATIDGLLFRHGLGRGFVGPRSSEIRAARFSRGRDASSSSRRSRGFAPFWRGGSNRFVSPCNRTCALIARGVPLVKTRTRLARGAAEPDTGRRRDENKRRLLRQIRRGGKDKQAGTAAPRFSSPVYAPKPGSE